MTQFDAQNGSLVRNVSGVVLSPPAEPWLTEALASIDPSLVPLFADGIIPQLVAGKRRTHVKLMTHDRHLAQKYQMVDESELLLD